MTRPASAAPVSLYIVVNNRLTIPSSSVLRKPPSSKVLLTSIVREVHCFDRVAGELGAWPGFGQIADCD